MSEWQEAQDASGKVYYYNSVTQETQWEKPGERQKKWSKHLDAGTGKNYFVNNETQETTWEEPADPDELLADKSKKEEAASNGAAKQDNDDQSGGVEGKKDEAWEEKTDADTGRTYYYNNRTKETQWWFDPRKTDSSSASSQPPAPPPLAAAATGTWLMAHDAEGKSYYYNSKTQETRWDKPDEIDSAPGVDPAPGSSGAAANPLGSGAANALAAGAFHGSAAYATSNKRARIDSSAAFAAHVPQADQLASVLGRIDASTSSAAAQAAAESSDAAQWTPHMLLQQEQAQAAAKPQYQDYTTQASFNAKAGRFDHVGGESYFERNNIPADKDGRQMSNFFDLNQLQANREEYKERKKKLLNSKVDWRKYKEKSKKKKQKRRNAWLLED